MSNWFKKAQEVAQVRYSGVILAEVIVPFSGAEKEYAIAAQTVAIAMSQAESMGSPLGVSFKFTPQGDYTKVS